MKNLFELAPKELVTDAFIAWLFHQAESNEKLRPYRKNLIRTLCGIENCDSFQIVECKLQEKSTDLVLTAEINGISSKILFENKTWSTIHSDQLARYKLTFPDCSEYRYLKLAFINAYEADLVRKNGYSIVTSQELYACLEPLRGESEILREYVDYLHSEFVAYPVDLRRRIDVNDPSVFSERQGQLMFLSDLYENLRGQNLDITIVTGTNQSGTPWSHLNFYTLANAYDSSHEYLFYRIDKRSGRTYLRIGQYADIDSPFYSKKSDRLSRIREICKSILTNSGLKAGTTHDRGDKESEVQIFFFDENSTELLQEKLPEVTYRLHKEMMKMDTEYLPQSGPSDNHIPASSILTQAGSEL